MDRNITLKDLSTVNNTFSKGIAVVILNKEKEAIIKKTEYVLSFTNIPEIIDKPEKYQVLEINTANDYIHVIVVETEEE